MSENRGASDEAACASLVIAGHIGSFHAAINLDQRLAALLGQQRGAIFNL
jgi:hypothetical protein